MRNDSPPAILMVSNLTKTFGEVVAVRNVSETFGKGEYVCILGPSGCGKSTFLRLIAGFEKPDEGDIFLEGCSVKEIVPERRNVNTVFQSYALFPHMTVYDNVAFGLKMKKLSREAIRANVRETLDLVNLTGQMDRYPRQLSGGQQQRVALARAVINHPAVLLLDEPLAALDKNLRLAMQDELRKIQREIGITFLHVTHDQNEALVMADRLAVMKDGVLVQAGPPQEVYNRPVNRFVAEFLGFSNIVDAREIDRHASQIILDEDIRLYIANHIIADVGRQSNYLIRPEKIELHQSRPRSDMNVFQGFLTRLRYAGPDLECDVEVGSLKLLVQTISRGEHQQLREGQKVFLHINPADIVHLPPPNGIQPENAGKDDDA